jgi:neutral ceramidase
MMTMRLTLPLAGFGSGLVRMICLVVLAGATVAPATEGNLVLRAGADRTDITPELGVPIPGGFNPPPASHVHDPLHVRTLVLDDGATRIAFVVADNGALPRVVCDEAKRLVKAQSKLPPSHILISATHSHSAGPAMRMAGPSITQWLDLDGFTDSQEPLTAYQKFLARRISASVQNAITRLEPARVGWGAGQVPEHVFNRRWFVKSEKNRRNPFGGVDRVRMNPPIASPDLIEPAGPTDPEVCFLSVQSVNGRPIALLANYSLHYVGRGHPTALSADYFGMFAERIGELLGASRQDPLFVGIMSNGTSGDIKTIDDRKPYDPEGPYVKMRRVANVVAAEVDRACQSINYQNWVKLDVRYEELALEPRRPSPEMVTHARKVLAGRPPGEAPWHSQEKVYSELVLLALAAPERLNVPVQAVRIGDLAIAVTPVETFAEMGLEIKARAPFAKAFTIELANGWYGYMPTVKQHELGGYESWVGVNRLEKEAAPKMVAALLRMMESMRP